MAEGTVSLRAPARRDEAELLDLVRKSRSLHRPWVAPPSTPERFRDYLRRCRLDRALYLLTQSDVPIKEIACEIGIPDLHAFNKAIRRGFGLAPRELRARGAAPNQTIAPGIPLVDDAAIIKSA